MVIRENRTDVRNNCGAVTYFELFMGLSLLLQSSSLQPLQQAWLFKHTLFPQLMFPAASRLPAFQGLSPASVAAAAAAGNSLSFCRAFLGLHLVDSWLWEPLNLQPLLQIGYQKLSGLLCSQKHLPLLCRASLLAAFAILFSIQNSS